MTQVLVDTSVWVQHFRERSDHLVTLLQSDRVMIHPMVLGELACGTPPSRSRTLMDLQRLRPSQQATLKEVLVFIEKEQLFGLGCGFVDLTLLVSVVITPNTALWTLDRKLLALADRLNIGYRTSVH